MGITKQEFLVLKGLAQVCDTVGRSDLDASTGLAPEEVDVALDRLIAEGLVVDGRINAKGVEALEPYRVKSAIIQAAGLCTRFAPIAYDMPKGLIEIRGEVLIERMIRQLHEAGIYDVVMVVGHKKEMYTYLGAKYGVRFVENPDYATTNTCRSLYFALDFMSRSYVLFSDTYFIDNPFERYVWEGFYATLPVEGPTDKWIFKTDATGYLTEMVKGGDEGEYAGGFGCLDETNLAALAPLIRAAQGDREAVCGLWETVWQHNADTVRVKTKCLPAGYSFEFDSMDDLSVFDPDYLNHVVSHTLDNICAVLSCPRDQIHDCYPLASGRSYLLCHFAVGEREYMYRQPMTGEGILLSRDEKATIEKEAERQGLNATRVYEDPCFGWMISRFVSGTTLPSLVG